MKKEFIIKLIFFLFLIISAVDSKDLNVSFEDIQFQNFSFPKEKELEDLVINLSETPSYTKLEILGDQDINYVLSIFSDETKENRIQLAQSVYKKSFLFLAQKQINSNKIYAEIECSIYPCSYELYISSHEKIILEEGEQLYYYVTEQNKNMDFEINLNSETVNIWSFGGKSVTNSLDLYSNIIKSKKNENYYLLINKTKVEFSLTGKVGDIINVGSLGYTGEKSNKKVMLDQETFTVFLQKENFSKACFDFGMVEEEEEYKPNYIVFLEGIIFNNFLKNYLKFDNGTENNEEVFNEKFSKEFFSNNLNQSQLCFAFPEEEEYSKIDEIQFSFYTTLGRTSKKGLNFYQPQFNGKLYSRSLKSDEVIAFTGLNPEDSFTKINFNIYNKVELTKMYIYECKNYPLCIYEKNGTISISDVLQPKNIDRFTTYSIKKDEKINPISKIQKLLIAYCDKSYDIDLYCNFDTLIYSDIDEIKMIEKQYFNQYLLKNEVNKFNILSTGESNIKQINIDIIIYVGEVGISIDPINGVEMSKYNYANKFSINLKLNIESENLENIKFKINAKKNAYYTIVFHYIRNEEDSKITHNLQAGINYLLTIDPLIENQKENVNQYLNIINDKSLLKTFLVSFYSINCKLEIKRKKGGNYTDIDKFDYCYEDVLSYWDEDESNRGSIYNYKIKIKENDFSDYTGKLCLAYVSSADIVDEYEQYGGDIVIPDNIPQQIIFKEKVKHIVFGHVHANKNDDLIVKFNLIHKAEYNVQFFFNNKENKTYTLYSNDAIFLNHTLWEKICYDTGELCYIAIDISLKSNKLVNEPVLEFSIKSLNGHSPTYLAKNQMKIDFVQNNAVQHYFTEVGIKEKGFILLNFYRSSGTIFAKLVEKNLEIVEHEEFPEIENDSSLPYDSFTKKIHFDTDENNCQNGCYLLISVKSNSESSSLKQLRNYPFSFIIESAPKKLPEDIPPMRINIDEYIIGDIKATENEIKEYYIVRLSRDAENLVIDLQSNTAKLYINVGEKKPNILEYDFQVTPKGKDTIYIIPKEQILEKTDNIESIKYIYLTIGVWSDINDSVYSTVYSFMIHLEDQTENIIHRVKTDRKTLCDTTEINDPDSDYKFRCLFVIEYYFIGDLNNLLLYPTLEDNTAEYNIYGKYIEPSYFEMGEFNEDDFPNNKSEFSTEKTNLNYLYIPKGLNEGNYLLLSIVSTKKTRIELFSTFYIYLDLITPNPNTPQLFLVKKDQQLILNFPTDNSLMANFISITGNAEIYWEDKPNYKNYLVQEDSRISLTNLKNKNGKLFVKSTSNPTDDDDDIGFAFYLNYNARYEHNFDELILGKSTIFEYSENDFPIVLYSKLEDLDKDVEISFTFYILDKDTNENLYNEDPIKANAIIVKEKTIYNIKSNSEITLDLSKAIKFIYDPALRSGFVRITKEQLKKFNINNEENPYLYIKLEKVDNEESFKRVNVEVSAHQENILVPISENIYQYGILLEKETQKEYILKTIREHKNLFIEFSSLNDSLSIKLVNMSGDEIENESKKESNGKYLYFFNINPEKDSFVKLIVFNNTSTEKNNMYTFKYMNALDINSFIEYKIDDDKIDVKINKTDYQIKVLPINNASYYNIKYFVKICNNKDKSVPNQSIIISNCDRKVIKEYNNPVDNNGELIFEFNNIGIIPSYIQITAQIYNNGINEFISYKIYEYKESDNEDIDPFPEKEEKEEEEEEEKKEEEEKEKEEEEEEEKKEEEEKEEEEEEEKKEEEKREEEREEGEKGEKDEDENENEEKPSNPSHEVNDDDDDDDDKIIALSVCLGVFFLIIVVLIVALYFYKKKNKDLTEEINTISFADNDKLIRES